MPFESEAQRRWMHANEPEMAEEWEEHTPKGKKLPKRKKPKRQVEEFELKLDSAFGLFNEDYVVVEACSEHDKQRPQSTNKVTTGASKGVNKGSPRVKHEEDEEDD
ncbi:MAG: hypothetical protein ACYS8Y_13850 [Planctomycetota bacterium]|jgi:hypothetical protein